MPCLRSCDATGTNLIEAGENVWSAELADSIGIDVDWLPEIAESADFAGELLAEPAEALGIPAGVPVFYGGGDSHCALLGLGRVSDGESAVLLGTNCTLRTVFETPVYDPKVRLWCQRHVIPDRWTISASSLAGASVLQWAGKVLNIDQAGAVTDTMEPACSKGLYFLPFINGERCPFNAPQACGTFHGLRGDHTAADMFRATKEGVCFMLKMCWEVTTEIGALSGHSLAEPVISGGGSRDKRWVESIAGVLGRTVHRVEGSMAGCLGAAMLAGIGAGVFKGYADAVGRMAPKAEQIMASSNDLEQLSDHYETFRELVDKLVEIRSQGV